jgi:ubiquitin-protein ligase
MVIRERVNQDILKINELAKATNNRIKITGTSGNPTNQLLLELRYITVPSDRYPEDRISVSKIQIDLLDRYPIVAPKVTFLTPIYNPNIFSHNIVCLGNWIPTEFLDLLVKRIVKLIVYDPLIINLTSPANSGATSWYRTKLHTNPKLFPTEDLSKLFITYIEKPKITFHDIN